MGRLERESYKPPQRFEAPPSDRGQGGQTPPGGDVVRLTPEPAEGRYTYPLKSIAQKCLADIRDYEEHEYQTGFRNMEKDIQRSIEQVWRFNPAPSPTSSLRHGLIKGFDFPRVAIPYMIVHDHPFFQGRNEKERFTERDKRLLLDRILVEDSKSCQRQLELAAWWRAYSPENYLDPDDKRWNEPDTSEYAERISEEDLKMYQRNLRVDRQLLRQLRQRGEAPPDRKVIPLR